MVFCNFLCFLNFLLISIFFSFQFFSFFFSFFWCPGTLPGHVMRTRIAPGYIKLYSLPQFFMTRRLTEQEKVARRPTSQACTFCHRKHLQCSNERPCKNCMKRNIGDQCQTIERKRAKYLRKGMNRSQSLDFLKPENPNSMLNTTNDVLNKLFSTDMTRGPSLDMPFDNFDSNYLDQEYKMLGDILINSKPASPDQSEFDSGSGVTNSVEVNLNDRFSDTRPFISLGFPNNSDNEDDEGDDMESVSSSNIINHLNNHNSRAGSPRNYMSPIVSHQVYKSVKDIYSNDIVDFDYPQSYHSLTFFLRNRFLGENLPSEQKQEKRKYLLMILKLIASYRPTFISAHKSLYKPWDLLFLEMNFQRSLIDFEKLSNLNSSPTIIWRRTGEIVSISNDLISLLGLDFNDILSKRTFLMELMYDDESVLNYFKLFKSVAVGNLHSSISTKCKLIKKNSSGQYIEFCSVWTVKRDLFDIPMLILGQFLPILSSDSFRLY